MSEIHLVTGGLGFIGSHLVEGLILRGKKVRIIDNGSNGDLSNVVDFIKQSNATVEIFHNDILDERNVRRAMRDVTHVYHLAAIGSVPRSFEYPEGTIEINTLGTTTVIEAARDAGVKRFVFASSSSIYGDIERDLRREEDPVRPCSPYALSKVFGEELCFMYHRVHGVPTVVLRYFNVFGPRQKPDSPYSAVVPRLASQLIRGRPPTIFGDGTQVRDFTYVRTAVDATITAGERPSAIGNVINVASGIGVSVNGLLDYLIACHGELPAKTSYLPPRNGDVSHSVASVSRMKWLLDTAPYDVALGVQETLDYFRGNI